MRQEEADPAKQTCLLQGIVKPRQYFHAVSRKLEIEVERDGQMMKKMLFLSDDWKKSDISWRGSMWGLRPKFKSWTPELAAEKKKLDEGGRNV